MANQPTEVDATRSSRRSLIKKAAATGAVAWTAPMIIDGVTNPAAAATCVAGGQYLVAYTGDRVQQPLLGNALNTCANQPGSVAVSAATVGLTAEWTALGGGANSLAHDGSYVTDGAPVAGNHRALKLTVTGCNCVIQSVYAHVHVRWDGNCPQPACQPAGSIYLFVVAGALNTATVTVRPNFEGTPCPFPGTGTNYTPPNGGAWQRGIHWGHPDTITENWFTTTKSSTDRFSSGYMVVRCSC